LKFLENEHAMSTAHPTSAHVTWVLPDGRRIAADVASGSNLMLAATFEGVPGIDGDCGGCLSCATCHVVVDAAWVARVGAAGDDENAMLDSTPAPRQPHSRLSCQIIASPALDGLLLHVPAA
jgi:2Fe-2S ferredoxin